MRVQQAMWVVLLALALGAGALGTQTTTVDPARVLAWIPYVRTTPEYDNVVKVLGFRPTETRTTDQAELGRQLVGKSVLLIPEQQETTQEALEALGKATSPVLREFLARGGLVVGMTFEKGADDILRGAGLWSCSDDWNLTGDSLALADETHPLGAGVAKSFKGPDGTTDFTGVPKGAVVVVWDPRDQAPVVFRWSTEGGTVIMIGFDYFAYNEATAKVLQNAVSGAAAAAACAPCPTPSGAVWSSVTSSDIERLLTELGLTFERKTDSYGDPYWSFRLGETKVALFVDDPTAKLSGKYQYLQLYAAWTVGGRVSCSTINSWNLEKRGSRAYLDRDNDPVLESDLYLRGGVTWDTLKQFIERFRSSVASFASHIAAK